MRCRTRWRTSILPSASPLRGNGHRSNNFNGITTSHDISQKNDISDENSNSTCNKVKIKILAAQVFFLCVILTTLRCQIFYLCDVTSAISSAKWVLAGASHQIHHQITSRDVVKPCMSSILPSISRSATRAQSRLCNPDDHRPPSIDPSSSTGLHLFCLSFQRTAWRSLRGMRNFYLFFFS